MYKVTQVTRYGTVRAFLWWEGRKGLIQRAFTHSTPLYLSERVTCVTGGVIYCFIKTYQVTLSQDLRLLWCYQGVTQGI